jgi:hypothetical protein
MRIAITVNSRKMMESSTPWPFEIWFKVANEEWKNGIERAGNEFSRPRQRCSWAAGAGGRL